MSAPGTIDVPPAVLAAYGFRDPRRITGGLINATFAVRDPTGARAILQRLHPVFGAEVNLDIAAVTAHLRAQGAITPEVLPTRGGAAWIEHDGVWRALSFIEGETIHAIDSLPRARAAGELVGAFHRALATFEHDYAFRRAGVHDTRAHLARLRALATDDTAVPDAGALAAEILATADALPALPALPRRHCHGDLKISNILFATAEPERALCLLDLDTVGRQTIAYELGDAFRSWCNPRGEDTGAITFELDVLAAGITGYAAGAGALLDDAEVAAIVPGIETVCVELACRFCVDAFEDRYFGWDPARFESRRAHNLVRARGQLALARSLAGQRDAARRVVQGALRPDTAPL